MKPKDADGTLRVLAERARAEAADDLPEDGARALAAGIATDADRAALARAARAAGVEADEASAAFEPLGPESMARLQQLAAGELVSRGSRGGSTASGAATNRASDAPDNVRPLWRRTTALVGALALAAGVAFFAINRAGEQPSFGPIPSYEMSVAGGVAETRSDPPPEPVLAPGARVVVTLRPATKVEGAVEARSFLVREGRSVPLALDAVVTPEGAVRLTGVVGDLAPELEGPAELVVTVVRPGAPHDPLARDAQGAQVVRRAIIVKKRGGE